MKRIAFIVAAVLVGSLAFGADTAKNGKDATITSEQMLLTKGGDLTLFKGNALLKQLAQWISADEMTRSRLTGVAHAKGRVRGTWFSDKGEKIVGVGDEAQYTPLTETTDLWGRKGVATLTRWETARDTSPVIMHGRHFVALKRENLMLAHDQVVIVQAPRFEAHADEARYNRTLGTLELWGKRQVFTHLNDGKGSGDFHSDTAWMLLSPRKARLTGHVTGHVIPSTT